MTTPMHKHPASKVIPFIEQRFLQIANLSGDIAMFPLTKENHLQVNTDKSKSDKFGEVFTPLWLVDEMLQRVSDYDWKNPKKRTLDLCAGYGQFTIRMLRKKFDLLGDDFDVYRFLKSYPSDVRKEPATHSFSELQLSSCYKLLFIFSNRINLFIGDSKLIPLIPDSARGIWYYCEISKNWVECTEKVMELVGNPKTYSLEKEEAFVSAFEEFINVPSEVPATT